MSPSRSLFPQFCKRLNNNCANALVLHVVKDGRLIAKNLSRMGSEILYNGKWEKFEFITKD